MSTLSSGPTCGKCLRNFFCLDLLGTFPSLASLTAPGADTADIVDVRTDGTELDSGFTAFLKSFNITIYKNIERQVFIYVIITTYNRDNADQFSREWISFLKDKLTYMSILYNKNYLTNYKFIRLCTKRCKLKITSAKN